jgi:ribonucleoside-triphosphate reductase
MQIIKKDGRIEQFDFNKIKAAVAKSAARLEIELTDEDFDKIKNGVNSYICDKEELTVAEMHGIVEGVLHYFYPEIGQAYSNYRNYKKDYAEMMTSVLNSADELNYKIDRSNANTTAALISTQRSLIFTALSKEIYKKLFLSREELQAIRDGYIYIHDLGSRAQTYNCCLFDMGAVLQGGFE